MKAGAIAEYTKVHWKKKNVYPLTALGCVHSFCDQTFCRLVFLLFSYLLFEQLMKTFTSGLNDHFTEATRDKIQTCVLYDTTYIYIVVVVIWVIHTCYLDLVEFMNERLAGDVLLFGNAVIT